MTHDEFIRSEIQRLKPWYHSFTTDEHVITGWEGIEPQWDNVRRVRDEYTYEFKDARVLDLGSRSGMWAFDAERLGAKTVVATDICGPPYYDQALLMRFLLRSKVFLFYSVPVEKLCEGLASFLAWNPGKFDIVQHLGLLYHLEDPICSLRQTRAMMDKGGLLLLETAIYVADDTPLARFNSDSAIYTDKHTFWAYNMVTLTEILKLTGFEIIMGSVSILMQHKDIGRVCLAANAI